MIEKLRPYLPEHAVEPVFELIKAYEIHLKIVNERFTRHGDYTRRFDGKHLITINSNLNPYRFLMTLIHEIAHLVAYQKYGGRIKPHGVEWKSTFRLLMVPFIRPEIFPNQLLPLLAKHFKNPTASSDTDERLSIAMQLYDKREKSLNNCYVYEVPLGSHFKVRNGKVFKRGPLRVKRFECEEVSTGLLYTFKANAEVELLSHYVLKS
ncbi:SprT-like domain-containing protein [Myroides pelagicus]|uniref:SprT domain-containing protein n=1 Tax=Myroides pelagicus TaxID=270914 RepID=A0A7K1GJ10_9FLAO|nr:SprT-like domain-containing protein [Myroides pelagicus]MEC4113754.1 SprT-like domain-containing protein [Myroides pelagicus]MTH28788.1 sprT domain-containing protein [Myroides pelagicus]